MITLRPATDEDLPIMFSWRNQPEIYQGFYQQQSPLKWSEHRNWWYSRPSSWKSFIIQLDETPIGVINIGQLDHWSPEIGWYVGEVSEWGKGYGKAAVKLAIKYLRDKGYEWCHTTIKWDNERSSKLAWKLGFQTAGQAREGEAWLVKDLTMEEFDV